MSEGLNRVILIGNLGADPELKFTNGNQAVLRLRLATTESYKGKNGDREQRTEWHSVTVWGRRAEALNKILEKGRTICVEGRIQYRQFEDKAGVKKTSTEIVAEEVLLLGGGRQRAGNEQRQPPSGNGGGFGGNDYPPGSDDFGDDTPF